MTALKRRVSLSRSDGLSAIAACLLLACIQPGAVSEEPGARFDPYRVTEPHSRSEDRRVTEIKTLKTVQEFQAPRKFEDWEERSEELRRRILVSCGLYPMPELGPLHYELFEPKEHDDYQVEKVLLRTYPGYYATGNLYRPLNPGSEEKDKYPAVLCPHGHWGKGRLEDSETASVIRRALSFAKQGYVCFTYDMVGYSDNGELISHSVGEKREELWGIHPAGFQLLTSIRAIDFLQSLEEVDPDRIGCTGASGGGTQTFFLSAVDDRVKVAAPVNMISSTMQGGCVCENAPGLRLDSNNMEIGALMAPRPLMLISASGDWTKLTPQVEYPAIRSAYWLYGVPQRVATHQEDAGHNYNLHSRQVVYDWFRKHFYPKRAPHHFVEPADLATDATEDLKVFQRRDPPDDVKKPEELFASLREDFEDQLMGALEKDIREFRDSYGTAYRTTVAVSEPSKESIQVDSWEKLSAGENVVEKFLLCDRKTGQKVPANLWLPAGWEEAEVAPVLLIHSDGKAGVVAEPRGEPGEQLSKYLSNQKPVLAIDCMATGEFTEDASATHRGKDVGHFATYNLTDAQCRIQDILLGETYLKIRFGKSPELVGNGPGGAWVLLAHGLAHNSRKTTVDLSGLDFEGDNAFLDHGFIPNLRRYGDFVTSIVLGADRPVEWSGVGSDRMAKRLEKAKEAAR